MDCAWPLRYQRAWSLKAAKMSREEEIDPNRYTVKELVKKTHRDMEETKGRVDEISEDVSDLKEKEHKRSTLEEGQSKRDAKRPVVVALIISGVVAAIELIKWLFR